MKMYVANASAQDHLFIYRIPEEARQRQLPIRRGSQIPLPDDLNQEQINAIVEQHERYGFVSTADVKSNNVKRHFTRLVYSIGQPVAGMYIEALLNSNHGVLDAQGKEIRRTTAIAANAAIAQELQKEREMNNLEADVGAVDITIQEEEPRGGYDRPSAQIIAEGFKVEASTQPQSHKPGRRRK